MKENKIIIRSSAADFLIFERQKKKVGVEVRFENEDLLLMRKAISDLYNVDRTVITKYIKNIYDELELEEKLTSAIFALVKQVGREKWEEKQIIII